MIRKLLVLTVYVGLTAATPGWAAGALPDWLAYGDLRGYLEPCGCDPATDMGGVKRLAGLFQRERLAKPDLLVLGLGNDLPLAVDEAKLKTPYLFEATARMRPAAVLFNELELMHRELVQAAGKSQRVPRLPYVLSNLSSAGRARMPYVAEVVTVGDARIFGYMWPREAKGADKVLRPLNDGLLAEWRKALTAKPGGTAILLFAGSDAELEKIAASGLFAVIVSSNTTPFATSPGTAERFDEKRLSRRAKSPDGGIHMVPIGGQGVLRGGQLRFAEAKALGDLLGGGTGQSPAKSDPLAGVGGAPGGLLKPETLVTWLEPGKVSEDALGDLFDRYNAAARSSFQSGIAARAKNLASSPFVGAEACAGCHAKAVEIWRGSKHARAMTTLKVKGKDQDGECVSCHVVGAEAKGGFVSMDLSPHLANVQCDNCHGPRQAHMQNPKANRGPKATVETCKTCHNATHSPTFDFAKFWPRIRHD